ncbi:hypothetical protein Q4519_16690 [Motilimonas sp. 1_MG-2023]|uniref:hypothetical protein n=1 Tax=Motilimonas sp. 1_MG-2023 TaxID=3062672 RepID=UPI0026E35E7F|nr:hypothetical protein [Motilimonas sp. 1_MG-2023]MDO6527317.1 hypothetical protein [Motilimonas sp. 1_MG-2023]
MFKRVCSPINISLFGLFAILALTYYFGLRTSHQRLQQQADIDAQKLSQYINSELSRFQHIPHLLTSHYLIRQSLSSAEGLERLNQLLLDITKTSGANDVYVMDNLAPSSQPVTMGHRKVLSVAITHFVITSSKL